MMRITVDISEPRMREVQQATGLKKKSPAINRAVEAYLREARKQNLDRLMTRDAR